jgi:hypothetical protein
MISTMISNVFSLSLIIVPILFIVMFVLEQPVDDALALIGYNDTFIASFPFVRDQYLYLTATRKIANISVAHFHILDIAVWLSVFMSSARLATIFIFFKYFDIPFQRVSFILSHDKKSTFSAIPPIYRAWLVIVIIVAGFWPMTDIRFQVRVHEWFYVMREFPKVYFCLLSICYYVVSVFTSTICSYLIWKIFRERLLEDRLSARSILVSRYYRKVDTRGFRDNWSCRRWRWWLPGKWYFVGRARRRGGRFNK